MAGLTNDPFGNCRVYYELFGGVPDDDSIQQIKMHLQIGGSAANIYYDQFQMSLYGRAGTVDSDNVTLIHRQLITRPAYKDWVDVYIDSQIDKSLGVRTLVLKMEATEVTSIVQLPPTDKRWQDQWYAADPAPWHLRLKSYTLYASDVKQPLTVKKIFKDIADGIGFDVSFDGHIKDNPVVDQLAMQELGTRKEALDTVNEMLGWDYFIWGEDNRVRFENPLSPSNNVVIRVRSTDPHVEYNFTENIDTTYNAVRVSWTDRVGNPYDVVIHGTAIGLGNYSGVKAYHLVAPDSCKTKSSAIRVGNRFLRDHSKNSMDGELRVEGISDNAQIDDALLLRPDRLYTFADTDLPPRMKATTVTLKPLEWSATIRFEMSPTRYDRWLARVAAGAHARRR